MYNPMDIGRIDRQIDELQRLKANYQSMQQPPQQPINNIITSQPMQPQQPVLPVFEAKFTNENPADVFIQNKTAFIDLKNGRLTIKEVDGELKEYGLIMPKDEKDIRIEELEAKMKNLENSYNSLLAQTSKLPKVDNIPNFVAEPQLPINPIPQNDVTLDKHLDNVLNSNDIDTSTNTIVNTEQTSKIFNKKGMFKQK